MSFPRRIITAGLMAFVLHAGVAAWATRTEVVKDDDFGSLQQGELDGVAISSDGFLYPTHARETVGDTGTAMVWAVVDQGGKGVLCATGHDGKLIRIDRKGEIHELGSAAETELTAMLELPDGSVLIAGAPGAQIYRFTTDDTIEKYVKLDAKFVWNLARDARGDVWAVTGTEGKLFRIVTKKGKVRVEDTIKLPSTNLIDIWIDDEGLMGEKGHLYIAGERPGYLYRYTGKGDDVEVLYDAKSDEVRDIEPTADGLAIATNTERAPTPQALNLTLRMSGAGTRREPGEGGAPGGGGPNGSEADMGDVFASGDRQQQQNPVSAVILIQPDGYAQGLWTSPERPIHAIRAAEEGALLVAAGGRGRIFKVTDDRRFSLVADTQEDYVLGLTPIEEGWLVTGARNGVVYEMSRKPEAEAVYRSRVIGSNGPVRWGRFYWRGERGDDQRVSVAFRLGNAEDPEQGAWEDWGKEQGVDPGQGVPIPAGPSRYMQYRLTMKTKSGPVEGFRTDYTESFYQAENRTPRLRAIEVSDITPPTNGGGQGQGGNGGQQQQQGGGPSQEETKPGGRSPHSNTGAIQVNWNAVDPNQDDLEFELFFMGDDETTWKLIQDELRQSNVPLQIRGVADGRYRFRVTASDKLSNPPGTELTDEIISDEFIVDNSPPRLEALRVTPEGRKARLEVRVIDEVSFVSSVEIDIDNEDAYPLFSEDGLFDEQEESIDWLSMELDPGEHVLTVAATDRQGNTEVRKVVFEIAE